MKVTITFDKLNVKNRFKKINVDNKIEKILVKMIAATGPRGPRGPEGPQGPQGETPDLTDYVKNTDYATYSKGGTIKLGGGLVQVNGQITPNQYTYETYQNQANNVFMGKGTLEKVIAGKALETANNKVTELTSSSTDTQYPSAKATYDELKKQKDTLESLMPKGEEEGTSISITDAAEYPLLKFEVNGNTSQDGTPTPDTPVEVKVVTGENVVSVSGKNLFNSNVNNYTISNTGEFVNDSDRLACDYEKINGNKITFSQTSGSGFFGVAFYDNNKNYISRYISGGVVSSITSDIPSGATYVRAFIQLPNNETANAQSIEKYKMMLELGPTATPYVPYSKTDYPISLGTIEMCKIGNYKDYFHKDSGKWYLHKDIGKVVLDGSEDEKISIDNAYSGLAYRSFNYPSENGITMSLSICFCNKLKYSENSIYANDIQGIKPNSIGQIKMKVLDNSLTSVSAFKTWLTSNNLIVYYILNTPTEEEITNTTLIEQLNALNNATLNKGNNTITSLYPDGNEQAILRVKYIRSLDIILASLENV